MHSSTSALARRLCYVLLIFSFLLHPGAVSVAQAQEPPEGAGATLEVTPALGHTQVRWLAPALDAAENAGAIHLPLRPYGRYLLPIQTVAVYADGDVLPAAVTSRLVAAAWHGQLQPADELTPPALDWSAAPWMEPSDDVALPSAPFFLLRAGRLRGVSIAIYAFSEIYQDASGVLRHVVEYSAALPASRPINDITALLPSAEPAQAESLAAPALAGAVSPPTNALAGGKAVKVFVTQAGIQQIDAEALAAAGVANPAIAKLRLYYRGDEAALHVIDANGDGLLSGGDSFRFYAPAPGDVWNKEDVYWLVVAAAGGLRMQSRSVSPKQAPIRSTGIETGVWTVNKIYESTIPGADGDNWFHLQGSLTPATANADAPSFRAGLGVRLPLAESAPEKSVFTLDVSVAGAPSSDVVPHRLQLGGGSVAYTDSNSAWVVDFGQGAIQSFSRRIETEGRTTALAVKLLPNAHASDVFFDRISWQQPVRLALGGKGAAFRGVEGTYRYQVSGAPAAWLYDVTDPLKPQILTASPVITAPAEVYLPLLSAPAQLAAPQTPVATLVFQDGPSPRDYLIAGDGTLHTPRLAAHSPVSFAGGADAVYIAPRPFHAALQPLVALRTKQGYKVQVVDVQAIYDAWGDGFVAPAAIRSFLRYATSAWNPSPTSAVLVGDGTSDPHNYLGFNAPNPNHIPPYLANVDPWIGVTACDTCYAQLDGDDPLTGDGPRDPDAPRWGAAFLLDIWLGRLPVATVDELAALVDKIVRYETAADATAGWQDLSIQLADDYIESADGSLDRAGNFWASVEQIIKLQPPQLNIVRVYYNIAVDPAILPHAVRQWYERVRPWLITEQKAAQAKALSTLSAGTGLATFTGHSNHWQWGRMGKTAGYDHRIFGLLDVDALKNRNQPFISLSMTCYTSQFTIPAEDHRTLDERLLLHPEGGAIATWGPAGLSIAHGHDALQTGFYHALWEASPLSAKLGALTQSGYNHIVLNTPCCQDVARTFVLLGDPLTHARARALDDLYVPHVSVQK